MQKHKLHNKAKALNINARSRGEHNLRLAASADASIFPHSIQKLPIHLILETTKTQ
jgi:hypothetical protein